jgi:hypothetical protein
VNETNNPLEATEGLELSPSPGVVPSGVEIKKVVPVQVVPVTPVQVSRKYTCGVIPSGDTFETRFVANETNAT